MTQKIKIMIVAVIVVLAVAGIGAGIVVAQTPSFRNFISYGGMMGQGGYYGNMMNGVSHSEMMGGSAAGWGNYAWMDQVHVWMSASGGMHDTIWKGLAGILGLTTGELNAQLAGGKTITQLAEAKGISQDQLNQKLASLVKAGLDQAVADKKITQEEADQMLQHMGGNYLWMIDHMSGGSGAGGCHQDNSAPTNNTQS